MKKQYIYILIGVISTALIGLVVIQLYWIDNAITLKEEGFKRSVRSAILSVSSKLEKIDIAQQIKKRNEEQELFYQKLNNFNSSIQNGKDSLAVFQKNGITYQVNERQLKNGKVYQQSVHSISPNGKVGFQLSIHGHGGNIGQPSILNEMLESLSNIGHRPIHERLNKNVIDSLLSFELLNRGIKAKFQYGVFDYDGNELIIDSLSNVNEIRQSGFYAQLFANDVFETPYVLTVLFPHKKGYIIKTMWLMLSTSVLLLIIIIFTFTFTIQTIFKQKKLSEVKNDFISNMTHELKTPISTISLACEALSDKDMSDDVNVRSNYIGMISQENKRLGLLVERVLKSATWDKADLKLNKSTFDLHEIINAVADNILIQVQSKSGTIKKSLEAVTSLINADQVHITNLINNLLDNANKYSPEMPQIMISTVNYKQGILLEVADKGQGIKRENINKIFEKFYRVPTGNVHNIKGFGLGLNYVKAIVKRHGGEISASSVYGKGSKFKIYIPFNHNDSSST